MPTTSHQPSSNSQQRFVFYFSLLIVYCSLLIGFTFRVLPLLQNRFHPDEALYASFARTIAAGKDVLLHDVVVDKPPLPFYTMAISMSIFGGTEFAARLPHLFASLISITLLYRVGTSLYNRTTGAFAAILFALSPISILFAITLFTDTMLITFILASILAISLGKWSLAGLLWGLAFACKQTSIFFLPLLAVIGLIQFSNHKEKISLRESFFAVQSFFIPIILCLIVIFAWDIIRQPSISFWAQGYDDNNPHRIIRTNEIVPRLSAWYDLTAYITGSRLIDLLLVIGLPIVLLVHRHPSKKNLYDYTLIGFTLSFLTAYWLLAFNVWDRYLLVLTPIIALLIARITEVFSHRISIIKLSTSSVLIRNLLFIIVHLLFIILLLPSALTASRSQFGIGGDHGAYDGIDEIATTLGTVPSGSVLYDYWLSWQWRFYLFESPVYVAWMPDTETIRKDLKAFGTKTPRYIVAPSWVSLSEVQTAIEAANFKLIKLQTTQRRDGTPSFTLYQIILNP